MFDSLKVVFSQIIQVSSHMLWYNDDFTKPTIRLIHVIVKQMDDF